MARVLPPPLVVVMVFLSLGGGGGGPIPSLAQQCSEAGVAVGEGEEKVVKSKNITAPSERSVNVFVMPKSKFQGLGVDVYGSDGTQHSAWFSAKPQCFPEDGDDQWHQLQVSANVSTDNATLTLAFMIGKCWTACKINNVTESLHNVSVVAYGPSRWIKGHLPSQCSIQYLSVSSPPNPTPTCTTWSSGPPPPTSRITHVILWSLVAITHGFTYYW